MLGIGGRPSSGMEAHASVMGLKCANLILKFKSYEEDYSEYNKILSFINEWAVQYENKRTLNFINNKDLIAIYEMADNLQTKYICNNKIGSESEFSDYIVNLLWNLRVIYKKNLEGDKRDGK